MKPEAPDLILVYKGRMKQVLCSVGYDVSNDVITSEIREEKNPTSQLIATWVVTNVTDGVDGELLLTLEDTVTSGITQGRGYMDLKRVTGGYPVNVFDEPLEVLFKDPVTA